VSHDWWLQHVAALPIFAELAQIAIHWHAGLLVIQGNKLAAAYQAHQEEDKHQVPKMELYPRFQAGNGS